MRAARATVSAVHAPRIINLLRISIAFLPPRLTRQRVLAPLPVQQFLYELDAPELHQLGVLLDPPVERHAYLPRPSERVLVFDGRFIQQVIRRGPRKSLCDLHVLAGEVPRT